MIEGHKLENVAQMGYTEGETRESRARWGKRGERARREKGG